MVAKNEETRPRRGSRPTSSGREESRLNGKSEREEHGPDGLSGALIAVSVRRAIVLAGRRGRRLKPLTDVLLKPIRRQSSGV